MINGKMLVHGFIFFNELDLLEIMLEEHNPFVDKFVLVESTLSYHNEYKTLYYEENKERYKKFHNKIIHIALTNQQTHYDNCWGVEWDLRNSIKLGLEQSGISGEDYVMITDLDEIVRSYLPLSLVENGSLELFDVLRFDLSDRNYYFNYKKIIDPWPAPIILKYKNLINSVQYARHPDWNLPPFNNTLMVPKAGWHFSYMGGVDRIIYKIEHGSHQEFNTDYFKNKDRILKQINEGKDLFERNDQMDWYLLQDNDYPEFILNNLDRFGKYFSPERI